MPIGKFIPKKNAKGPIHKNVNRHLVINGVSKNKLKKIWNNNICNITIQNTNMDGISRSYPSLKYLEKKLPIPLNNNIPNNTTDNEYVGWPKNRINLRDKIREIYSRLKIIFDLFQKYYICDLFYFFTNT